MDELTDVVTRIVGRPVVRIDPLAGDASTRRYYRISHADGTVIVMQAPDDRALPLFVAMTGLMRRYGVDTPTIIGHEGRYLVQEDLGDVMVQNHLVSLSSEAIETEYCRLLDDLVAFQTKVAANPDRSADCFSLAFDREKLTFETDFAQTHFVGGFLHRTLTDAERQACDDGWREVNEELAAGRETLCHRDFHARNIMVAGDRRVWIDYQDARMGRLAYDVASLLEDPYVAMADEMRARLVDYYVKRATGAALGLSGDFSRIYRLTAAQRLYKALGTYGYQTTVRKTAVYLSSIPPAVARFLRVADGIGPLAPLRALLASI